MPYNGKFKSTCSNISKKSKWKNPMKFHTKIRDCFELESFSKNLLPGAVAAMLLTPGAAMAIPSYTITDIGQWQPVAINDVGQIAGNVFDLATSQQRAALWSNGEITPLGPSDVTYSVATDINIFGQVVGTSQIPMGTQGTPWRAVKYTGASVVDLGAVDGGNSSEAAGINNSGQVVGRTTGYINIGGNSFFTPNVAFLHSNGVLNALGEQIGLLQSAAIGINDNGQIAGNDYGSGNAFLYDSLTAATKFIPSLPGDTTNYALAINNSGQVIGHSYNNLGYLLHSYLYDGTSTIDISPPGTYVLQAFSINDQSQIVGYGDVTGEDVGRKTGLFLYENGNMKFWDELIPEGSGWNLSAATGTFDINNNGQIVGVGNYGSEQRGFLLTPVDAPPATDIQYININSNGVISGESFNPAYPTVVVTHGWQYGVALGQDPLSQSFPLADVSQAVAARAIHDDQPLNLITYQWAGAYTDTFVEYNTAAIGVSEAGLILGRELNSLFNGAGYTGGVHMIGHSLGASASSAGYRPVHYP
ncbi:MAG: hypothetical protein ACSLFJ_11400 [Immundisolibacter sp.]|uniref:hypothetical protein n=1 Tax=Immundisolibacter sp. TaxID=1934948 RepID=UPI003EE30221